MQAIRSEIAWAMAGQTAETIREWAAENLPDNYKARVIIRAQDHHVETRISRYHSKTKRWIYTMFVFPGAADERFIDNVMVAMVTELASTKGRR